MALKLLSIVIPTKDRFPYLVSCLKSLLRIETDKIEIVVHDNSSENELVKLVETLQSDNFTYFHTKEKLSGTANFDAAIEKASGKYVMVIGDDDGCSTQIVSAVEDLDKDNLDALLMPKAIYFWPDISFKYFSKKFSGQLFISNFSSDKRIIDSAKQRNLCLASGACEILKLPRVYHGIVKKESLKRVKSVAGVYSPGPSPDIANAIALSHVVKTFRYMDVPLLITGNAAKSGAGMGAAGKHIGKIGTISFLPENAEASWSEYVPRFWSGQTVWAQSVLLAMRHFENDSYKELINLPLLHAKTYVFNSGYRKEVMRNYWELARSLRKNKPAWVLKFALGWLHAQGIRVIPFITKIPYLLGFNKSFDQQRFCGLLNVNDAALELDKFLERYTKGT